MNLFPCFIPLIASLIVAIPIWITTCIANRKIKDFNYRDNTGHIIGFLIYAIGVLTTAIFLMIETGVLR